MYSKWLMFKIKQNICSVLFWLILVISLLLMQTVRYMDLRMSEKKSVYMAAEEGSYSKALLQDLLQEQPEGYEIVEVSDEEAVKLGVIRGQAYCGVVLTEELDRILVGEFPEDGMKLYVSADTGASDVLQEVIFPYLLRDASPAMLRQYYLNAGLTDHSQALQVITAMNEQLLSEYHLHLCDVQYIDGGKGAIGSRSILMPAYLILLLLILATTLWEENRVSKAYLRVRTATERTVCMIISGMIRVILVGVPILVMFLVGYHP